MDRRLLAFLLIFGFLAFCFLPAIEFRFGWRAATRWNADVEAELVAEIEEATDLPAWAGVYSGSRLLNCWEKLVLAPSGRFTWHSSCCIVTDERAGGRLEVRGDRVRLVPDRPIEDAAFESDLRLVAWGADRYLLGAGQEAELVNLHNQFAGDPQPTAWRRWIGALRSEPASAGGLPAGHPALEGLWHDRLLADPVVVRCVEAIAEGERLVLRFDRGEEDGLWEGQRLWRVEAEDPLRTSEWVWLEEVEAGTAWADVSGEREAFEGGSFTTHPWLRAEEQG